MLLPGPRPKRPSEALSCGHPGSLRSEFLLQCLQVLARAAHQLVSMGVHPPVPQFPWWRVFLPVVETAVVGTRVVQLSALGDKVPFREERLGGAGDNQRPAARGGEARSLTVWVSSTPRRVCLTEL